MKDKIRRMTCEDTETLIHKVETRTSPRSFN